MWRTFFVLCAAFIAPSYQQFTLPLQNLSVEAGQVGYFYAVVQSSITENGAWVKDDITVINPIPNKISILISDNTRQLVIQNAQNTDEGKYTLQIGGGTTSGYLTVTGGIATGLQDRSVTAGNDVVLSITLVNTVPMNQVRWDKYQQQIFDNNKYDMGSSGTTYTLTIRNVNTNDAGEYTFTTGGLTSSMFLTVVPTADVNECAQNTDNCHPQATCANSPGSFSCSCNSGYTGNGVSCSDVNECALSTTNNCNVNAVCQNTVGSYQCACNSGFTGNGVTCTPSADVNECLLQTDNCHSDATCFNTVGSFTCRCNAGFAGDGISCQNVNECLTSANNCNGNAQCLDNRGSFSCICNTGYSGNGVICNDIDECTSSATNNCSPNAQCINAPGTYQCNCNNGFTGNGFVCTQPSGVSIVLEITNQTTNEGSTATLFTLLSQENVDGVWYKDGVAVVNTSSTLTYRSGPYKYLTIFQSKPSDSGQYMYQVAGLTTMGYLTVVPSAAINGNWGSWTLVNDPPCGITCGQTNSVFRTRSRQCNNPPPSNGGVSCPGSSSDQVQKSCVFQNCPVTTVDLCSNNVLNNNGIGYRNHPTDCDKYIQCYTYPNGLIVGVYRSCPFGFYWDQSTLRCSESWKVTCATERCTGKCKPNYGMSGSCRAYWQCTKGVSEAKCCMPGFMYEEGKGCRPNFFCRDTCPTSCADKDACAKRPTYDGDITTYNISVGLLGWMPSRCVSGSYFEVADCGCSPLQQSCQATYDVNFNSLAAVNALQNSWLRASNVNFSSGYAIFAQDSTFSANIQRSSSSPFNPLILIFRYRETGSVSGRRVLLSTSDCKQGNTLVIARDDDYITFEVSSYYGNVVTLPISLAGFSRYEWTTVSFLYNGYEVIASVNRQTVKYYARVYASDSNVLECGMRFGTDGQASTLPFVGELDRIAVYNCNPGSLL